MVFMFTYSLTIKLITCVHPKRSQSYTMDVVKVTQELRRLSMMSTTHVKEQKRELAKDVHRLSRLIVKLMVSTEGGIVVTNGAESSLV